MDELFSRALTAYFKTAKREGYEVDQPSESGSGLENIGDKRYIVLRNMKGILAVYRVRPDYMLKRLRRWPAELGASTTGECRDEWRMSRMG